MSDLHSIDLFDVLAWVLPEMLAVLLMRIRKCILRDYADLVETEKEEIYNWVCHVLIMLQFEDYAQAFVKDERQGAISLIKHKLIFTLP